MRKALLALGIPLLLAGRPLPTGTVTLVDTNPPTFTAVTKGVPKNTGHVWVSLSCFDEAGDRVYYGEEVKRDGLYVMDDTVWVLWTPGATPQPGNVCRGFLLFKDDRQAGEVVLDVIDPFVVVQ